MIDCLLQRTPIREFLFRYPDNLWQIIIPKVFEIAVLNLKNSFNTLDFTDQDFNLILLDLQRKQNSNYFDVKYNYEPSFTECNRPLIANGQTQLLSKYKAPVKYSTNRTNNFNRTLNNTMKQSRPYSNYKTNSRIFSYKTNNNFNTNPNKVIYNGYQERALKALRGKDYSRSKGEVSFPNNRYNMTGNSKFRGKSANVRSFSMTGSKNYKRTYYNPSPYEVKEGNKIYWQRIRDADDNDLYEIRKDKLNK